VSMSQDMEGLLEDGSMNRMDACFQSVSAGKTKEGEHCPADCPFWAEDLGTSPCVFQCVTADRCGTGRLNPNATIPERGDGRSGASPYCRTCKVEGCQRCYRNREDKCAECKTGYHSVDGGCHSKFTHVFGIILGVTGTLVLAFLAWYIELLCRPAVNMEGLREGLNFRSRTKLHQGFEVRDTTPRGGAQTSGQPEQMRGTASLGQNQVRPLWPLTTNLLQQQVAGPGMTLNFTFQAAVIVWSSLILVIWLLLCLFTDQGLFSLGFFGDGTWDAPIQYCRSIFIGHHEQERLHHWKLKFLAIAYVVTFALSIIFAAAQHRRFVTMDDATTMGDFAALCVGLPHFEGTERAEEEIKELIEKVTEKKVTGVSICWDYNHAQALVDELSEELADDPRKIPRISHTSTATMGADLTIGPEPSMRMSTSERVSLDDLKKVPKWKTMLRAADMVFPAVSSPVTQAEVDKEDIEQFLKGLRCSGKAFVVFDREDERDAATMEISRMGGLRYKDNLVRLQVQSFEPETVLWQNFTCVPRNLKIRMLCGVGFIFLALLLWLAIVYLPYAWFSGRAAQAGTRPSKQAGILFMLIVVGGNQLMYLICSIVTDRVGFLWRGDQQAAYMCTYIMACLLNVVLDVSLSGWKAYQTMVTQGTHASDGRLLEDLDTMEEIFKSYPMQHEMGRTIFYYGFPCCFLVPFILEPFFAILLPFHLMAELVRTRPELRKRRAESALKIMVNMDLGRYADIHVNIIIAVLTLFFPSGFTAPTFFALTASHVYLYCYDHYRVLRCVPEFCFSKRVVDDWSNLLMITPCALLLTCLVFKSNCTPGKSWLIPCTTGGVDLFTRCLGACLMHVSVHLILLIWFVPWLGRVRHRPSPISYKQLASTSPATWFSLNPVHCLRSRYFYEDKPCCSFYRPGKDHTMLKNANRGSYYEAKQSEVEAYPLYHC